MLCGITIGLCFFLAFLSHYYFLVCFVQMPCLLAKCGANPLSWAYIEYLKRRYLALYTIST